MIPLLKDGKVKAVGVSNHNLAEIKEADAILKDAGFRVSAVQNHFSLVNRSSETGGILDWCKENDVSFWGYMVLEQGALSGKYDTAHPFPAGSARAEKYGPMLPAIEKVVAAMRPIAEAHQANIAQIPTAWAMTKGVLPIIGVTKVPQVEDAAKLAEIQLTAAEMKTIETAAAEAGVSTIREWEKDMSR